MDDNKTGFKDWGDNFQTPDNVCQYMASFCAGNKGLILEPTPGKGKLVKALHEYGDVIAPEDFNKMPPPPMVNSNGLS